MQMFKKTTLTIAIFTCFSAISTADTLSDSFLKNAKVNNTTTYETYSKESSTASAADLNPLKNSTDYQKYPRPEPVQNNTSAPNIPSAISMQPINIVKKENNQDPAMQVMVIKPYGQNEEQRDKPLEAYGRKEVETVAPVSAQIPYTQNVPSFDRPNPYNSTSIQYPAPKPKTEEPKQLASPQKTNSDPENLPGLKFVGKNAPNSTATPSSGNWEPLKNYKDVPVISVPEIKRTKREDDVQTTKEEIAENLKNSKPVKTTTIDSKPGINVSTPSKLSATDIEFIKLAKKESDLWTKLDNLPPEGEEYVKTAMELSDIWNATEELKKKTGTDPMSIPAVVEIKAASDKRVTEQLAKKKEIANTQTDTSKKKEETKDNADKTSKKEEPKVTDVVIKKEESKTTDSTKKKDEPKVSDVIIKKDDSKPTDATKKEKPEVISPKQEVKKPMPLVITPGTKLDFEKIEFDNDKKPIKGKNKKTTEIEHSSELPSPVEVKVTPITQPEVIKTSLDK